MSAPLIIAVPSKGRLQERTEAFFAQAGLVIRRVGAQRTYRGEFTGIENIQIAFLSAGEIAGELATGGVHLGVTGTDLIFETIPTPEAVTQIVTPLDFGEANVVVAVPQAWIDVRTMADLDDVARQFRARHRQPLRVATKYVSLTAKFFASHGMVDYRIVQSTGATEGAPAAGAAEIIVDITSTGTTLAANGLKIVADGVILKSRANLVASLQADWDGAARRSLAQVLGQIDGQTRARAVMEVRASWSGNWDAGQISALAGEQKATLVHAHTNLDGGGEAVLLIETPSLYDLVGKLRAAGAAPITATAPNYVFEANIPALDRLLATLDGRAAR
ncbi:MAG: ATP phosphoribosyltransferase [Alphaproteobacteria bacterium]